MRCHYLSDLHLETQEFRWAMPQGDVLLIAGDLCHAAGLDPARTDPFSDRQRDRVLRFANAAVRAFATVILVPGNHEHRGGVFDDTAALLRRYFEGFTILDDDYIDIGGVRFFGTTLWTDMAGCDAAATDIIRRGMGEYFFTKKRHVDNDGNEVIAKLRPADTIAAYHSALRALGSAIAVPASSVIVSHHAPSLQGLNPRHRGNALDAAFASDLEDLITALSGTKFWVHGHTHTRARYRIGNTTILANCRGFDGKDLSARSFTPDSHFEV